MVAGLNMSTTVIGVAVIYWQYLLFAVRRNNCHKSDIRGVFVYETTMNEAALILMNNQARTSDIMALVVRLMFLWAGRQC